MKKENIRAYFAGDQSKERIELALKDATDNRKYWEHVKSEAVANENHTVLSAADTVLNSSVFMINLLKNRLAKAVAHA